MITKNLEIKTSNFVVGSNEETITIVFPGVNIVLDMDRAKDLANTILSVVERWEEV